MEESKEEGGEKELLVTTQSCFTRAYEIIDLGVGFPSRLVYLHLVLGSSQWSDVQAGKDSGEVQKATTDMGSIEA